MGVGALSPKRGDSKKCGQVAVGSAAGGGSGVGAEARGEREGSWATPWDEGGPQGGRGGGPRKDAGSNVGVERAEVQCRGEVTVKKSLERLPHLHDTYGEGGGQEGVRTGEGENPELHLRHWAISRGQESHPLQPPGDLHTP